jgi:hypothetical protein
MANIIKLKKSAVENRKPTDLELGEIALNYHDGNIYYKDSDANIAEMKRLDERLNATDVQQMYYDSVTDDLKSVFYVTGNAIILNYDVDGDLDFVDYYATDCTLDSVGDYSAGTKLFTQTLTYDVNKNLVGTTWSAA